MPACSCPGWSQKKVYVPAGRLSIVSTAESPAESSSLPAIRLPEPSLTIRSWEIVPPLTTNSTTLPWVTEMVEGSNLYSVSVTLIEPDGWPPLLPPHAASSRMATKPIDSALEKPAVRITPLDTGAGYSGGPAPCGAGPPRICLGQHLELSCGFGITAVMMVPANRATSGVPYSAAPPKLFVVTCLMVFPKFHSQTLDVPPAMSGWTPIVQNG